MGWLVILAILTTPFVLLRYSRYPVARLALAIFWIGCAAGGAWFLSDCRKIEKDLETVHPYPLPNDPGTHRVTIAPLSQNSMKGVITGASPIPLPDLETLEWRFTDKFVQATWFTPKDHDGVAPGETLLFYVQWGGPDGPLTLEYRVDQGKSELLRERSLVVRHDASAAHMLRDHALAFLKIFAWGLLCWSGLWMIVQIAGAVVRRTKPEGADSPTRGGP